MSTISHWRIYLIALGYGIALLGGLTMFLVPLHVSVVMLFLGGLLALASFIKPPPMNRTSGLVYLAGCAVLAIAVWFLGTDRISHWRPMPFGMLISWMCCFHGFRHIRYALSQNRMSRSTGDK